MELFKNCSCVALKKTLGETMDALEISGCTLGLPEDWSVRDMVNCCFCNDTGYILTDHGKQFAALLEAKRQAT